MTALPETIPLDHPRGDPAALDELVQAVARVAHLLTVLAGDLTGPSAAAPGWLGADATAAAAQIGSVAGLSHQMAGAVLLATARLSAYADRLGEARRRVDALREEQDEDYRRAWRLVSELPDPQAEFRFGGPAAAAVVEEFRAGEDSRRRRHAALLTEVEAEAAVVASALREAGAVVGGHGRPGDDVRALAHLATLLPGWGEEELAARGAALAAQLGDFDGDPELEGIQDRMAHAARAALPLSGTPAFADAVLARLGVDGVRDLLTALGRAADPATSPVAALLASVLGVASSGGPSWAVVDAPYAGAQGVSVDLTVAGMTAVLAAGAVPGARGLRPATVALWTRQFLLLDKAEGRRVGERVTYRWSSELADPVAVGMGVLARSGAPHVVAGLLEEAAVWTEALSRWWRDGGDAFGELVHQLRLDDSSTGARAVRVALEVIGSGLTPGDLSARTVRRDTVDAVSSSLAHAVAAHVPVAVEALSVGVDGLLRNGGAPLRALGYLSVGSGGAAAMQEAILDWSRDRPVEPGDASSFSPAPAVAIPAAYMAAREYGQRLDHALDAYEIKEEAEAEAERWDKTFGLLGFLPGPWGLVGGVAEGSAAIALGMDGRFDAGVDRGLRFDADDAVDVASAATSPDRSVDLAALDEQARAAFARTGRALGDVAAPVSEESDLAAVFADGLRGLAQERVVRALKLLRGGD